MAINGIQSFSIYGLFGTTDVHIPLIRLLWQDAKSERHFLTEKIHFAFGDGSSLNHVRSINIFSAYAETPDSLLTYLEQVTTSH